jgi:NAD(P)-dependent dehydrogenase (short-subunit alcohol dehydrogenase family)
VAITGASKGIGRATALSFAKAGAGGIVLLARSRSDLSRLEDELVREANPPQILSLAVDVTDRAAVEKAAATVKSRFGKVDVLINNAGYLGDWAPIADSDPEDWWKTWEVNVKGVYLVTKFFVPLLLEGALKTVVAVSSIGAIVTTPRLSAYETTKAAMLKLNDYLMAGYGDKGLIAFGIHPGVSEYQDSSRGRSPCQRGRKWLLLFPGSQSINKGKKWLLFPRLTIYQRGEEVVVVVVPRLTIYFVQGVLTALASSAPKAILDTLSDEPELAGDSLVWLTKERREWYVKD